MTDILTAAQRVRRYLEDTQAGHDNLAELDKAQYFEISPSVYDAAWDSANILIDQEDPVIPIAAQLPASSCMLWRWGLQGLLDQSKYLRCPMPHRKRTGIFRLIKKTL